MYPGVLICGWILIFNKLHTQVKQDSLFYVSSNVKLCIQIFLFIISATAVHCQTFEDIELEDKSELKTDLGGWTCYLPLAIPPEYPGGQDSLNAFLYRNLTYPKTDTCGGYDKIWVGFLVEVTGKISEVQILNGSCTVYINEVLRVFSFMPYCIPGKESGKNVQVRFQMPIIFSRK
jgi:hypothetical protein